MGSLENIQWIVYVYVYFFKKKKRFSFVMNGELLRVSHTSNVRK